MCWFNVKTVRYNTLASIPVEKLVPVESHLVKSLETSEFYLMREQKVTLRSDMHTIGSGEAASDSFTMLRPLDQDPFKLTPYYPERKSNNMLSAQYENSLFSSSLSDLFCRKCKLMSRPQIFTLDFFFSQKPWICTDSYQIVHVLYVFICSGTIFKQ